MTAISSGCRIGKIRLKSGGELKLLPNARQASTDKMFEQFRKACGWMKELYAADLDGFVLVAWRRDGEFNTYVSSDGGVHINTLPEFVAEAVRRDIASDDMRDMLNGTLGHDG